MSVNTTDNLEALVEELARSVRRASHALAIATTDQKNQVLAKIAELCIERKAEIQRQNALDIQYAHEIGLSNALVDRLLLDDGRIEKMVQGIEQVTALPDPVGEEMERMNPPSGMDIRKIRVPIGVVGIIYESRPNVTVDCAVLCIKSGNAPILRGGKEAFHSNKILVEIISQALDECGFDPKTIGFIPTPDRAALNVMLKLDDYIHCIIPRGGEGLIRFVAENSTIPVIKHFTGICNVYIDADADKQRAVDISVNAKAQRPGVCNAAENLFIHDSVVGSHLPPIAKAMQDAGVELRISEELQSTLDLHKIPYVLATEEDFYEEYLDYIISIKSVDSVESAIDAINQYGSAHSDAIITEHERNARLFLRGVDSATVYWNASTRFTDGFEFGLGAEIGISTDRLHARGPMGLKELCTYKYVIYGKGETK